MAIVTARPPKRKTYTVTPRRKPVVEPATPPENVTPLPAHHLTNSHIQTASLMGTLAVSLTEHGEIMVAKRLFELAATTLGKIST